MTNDTKQKTLGQAIDEIVGALAALDNANRAVAIRAACDHLGVTYTPPDTSGQSDESDEDRTTGHQRENSAEGGQDIRHFKERKQPSSAMEMACVVAYYLQSMVPTNLRKSTVTAADMDNYFRQGDFPLPKRLGQLLPDAKGAGYFDSAGRGEYKLNPVGHNLVVHRLPRGSADAQGVKPRKSGTKRPQKKASANKTRRAKKS